MGEEEKIAIRDGTIHHYHQWDLSTAAIKHPKYVTWRDDMYGDLRSFDGLQTLVLRDYGIKLLLGILLPLIFDLH